MIWKNPAEWLFIFMITLAVIGYAWQYIEIGMYGYTQESICDFAAAAVICKSIADEIVRRIYVNGDD